MAKQNRFFAMLKAKQESLLFFFSFGLRKSTLTVGNIAAPLCLAPGDYALFAKHYATLVVVCLAANPGASDFAFALLRREESVERLSLVRWLSFVVILGVLFCLIVSFVFYGAEVSYILLARLLVEPIFFGVSLPLFSQARMLPLYMKLSIAYGVVSLSSTGVAVLGWIDFYESLAVSSGLTGVLFFVGIFGAKGKSVFNVWGKALRAKSRTSVCLFGKYMATSLIVPLYMQGPILISSYMAGPEEFSTVFFCYTLAAIGLVPALAAIHLMSVRLSEGQLTISQIPKEALKCAFFSAVSTLLIAVSFETPIGSHWDAHYDTRVFLLFAFANALQAYSALFLGATTVLDRPALKLKVQLTTIFVTNVAAIMVVWLSGPLALPYAFVGGYGLAVVGSRVVFAKVEGG